MEDSGKGVAAAFATNVTARMTEAKNCLENMVAETRPEV